MFGFSMKNAKESKKESSEEVTAERKDEILRSISLKKDKINQSSEEEQARIYEEIGLAFNELGEEDNAIDSLEKALKSKSH